jgi:hypothetical protein
MFNYTKYTKWYNNIIKNATNNNRNKTNGYYEKHHIIPKSLGGTNDKKNLILLTPREHYICHWLLLKMVDDGKSKKSMFFAFMKMSRKNVTQSDRYNSKQYNNTKTIYSKTLSGKNNPCYGRTGHLHPAYETDGFFKGHRHTEKTKIHLSEIQKGIPKHSDEFKQHMKNLFQGKQKSTEHRKNMSLAKLGKNKGKTYEEIYGVEKAKELRIKRSESMKRRKSTH